MAGERLEAGMDVALESTVPVAVQRAAADVAGVAIGCESWGPLLLRLASERFRDIVASGEAACHATRPSPAFST